MTRRIVSLMLAVLMLLSIVSAVQAETKSEYEKHLTIQVNVRDTEKIGKDPKYQYLEERFNVTFDYVACSLNDVKEKVRIWVASDDMPEIMWMDHKMGNTTEVREWIQEGVFREFPDLHEKYPNLAHLNDLMQTTETLKVDGKQYIYLASRGFEQYDNISQIRFYYRADWAEQLGMYQEEYTWDEMVALVKAFIEKDPGGNGAGKTIGIVSANWAFPSFAGIQQCNPYYGSFHKVDGRYVWGPAEESTIEGLKIAKQLYDEGVIWKDQPLSSDADRRYTAGQAGVLYTNMNTSYAEQVMADMEAANPDIDVTKAVALMKVSSPNGGYYVEKTEDYYGGWGFRADISDEKMDRFLAIMDFIASPEGRLFHLYGIEGEDFELVDGNVVLLGEKDENGNIISRYKPSTDRLFSFVKLTSGELHLSPVVRKEARDLREFEIAQNAATEGMYWAEIDYEYVGFSAPNKDKYNLGSECNDKMIELIVSSTDIEADYREWLAKTQPKADLILKELNEDLLGLSE